MALKNGVMTAKQSHHRNQLYLYIFKIPNGYYKFVMFDQNKCSLGEHRRLLSDC